MQTPTLHLNLGGDAEKNRNWSLIDQFITKVINRSGQIIAGDLEVTGNLTVDGTSTLTGATQATTFQTQTLTATGLAHLEGGLLVDGTEGITLPAGSIDGSALAGGAAVQCWASGTAHTYNSGDMRLTHTPAAALQLASVTVPTNESTLGLELVIGQLTYEVFCPNSTSILPSFWLQRGSTPLNARNFTYAAGTTVSIPVTDFPLTLVWLSQPTDTTRLYSLYMQSTGGAGTTAWCDALFAQVHCVQLR